MVSKNKSLPEIVRAAKAVLKANDHSGHTVPSEGLYDHQVLWDSCFIAIGLSHYDSKRARKEVERLFSAQWSNGMIPHIIFDRGNKYWWARQMEKSSRSPNSVKGLATSGITQPPMLAEAIVSIGQKLPEGERKDWYKSVFNKLVNYHMWLYRERDPRHEGLVTQIHPWETGLDTSPPSIAELRKRSWPSWLKIFDNPLIDKIGYYFRVDTKFVALGERSSNAESLALFFLQLKLRRAKYDSARILKNPTFTIQDITYNSILIRANQLLEQIARVIGEELPNELQRYTAKTTRSLESLWDRDKQSYYSRELSSNKLIKEPSIGTFLPLYSGAISNERATLLARQIELTTADLAYPIPSVPVKSKWFKPNRYWQGPTWINTNWLIIEGLKRYGFEAQAKTLTLATLKLVSVSGFYEYFDPAYGTPSGANNFSWTAALTLDLAENFRAKR